MCLRTSSRDMVESSLMLDRAGFKTGTVAGEGLATGGAAFDGCATFDDTGYWVMDGIGAGACLAE